MMIDTSMYTVDTEKYLKCYNAFLANTEQHFDTGDALIEHQNKNILEAIASNMDGQLKHIIISGHHPIIGVKMTDDGEPEVLNDIPIFEPILQEICKITNNALKYYYLCADLHLYQKGKINLHFNTGDTMVINQYIVGTGGTKLDDKLPTILNGSTFNNDNIEYILKDCQQMCGFLECVIINDPTIDPIFNFISVPSLSLGGSTQTRRKYKKRKYKKLKCQYTRKRRRNITHKKRYK
jgi:hypothetical protein